MKNLRFVYVFFKKRSNNVLICLIRLDFLLFRGDQFEDLLVVLRPCRAEGHVVPDHPFLCAFVCFWMIFLC